VASEEGWVTVPKGKENQISVTPELPNVVAAPIQKNQIIAKTLIQNEGKVLREVNLISPVEVPKGFLPPWPITVAIGFGILLVLLISFWWIRMRKTRAKPLR